MVLRSQNAIFIRQQTGWVRIFLSPIENFSSVVYATDTTTVEEIKKRIDVPENFTVWVEYLRGTRFHRLQKSATPLQIQDEILQHLGYGDSSRRIRLGADPSLANLVKFVVGPASNLGVNQCGYLYVLKGLVLPQWKRRLGAIVHDKFFLYSFSDDEEATDVDMISLSGAKLSIEKHSKFNKYVVRVVTYKQLFFGFENVWERNIWTGWLRRATATETSLRKLDLSECGVEKIPKIVLSTWTDLEELKLCRNQLNLEEPSLKLLLGAPKLRRLTLANTGIKILPKCITKLKKLEYLDLSQNFLATLSDSILELTSLAELILDQNDLSDIPMLDELAKLRSLSAAYNNLANDCFFIRKGMRPDNDAANEKNQFVLRSNLSIVNLKANSLKGIIKLANYGNLTDLDVSENSIEQLDLSSLSSLKCINCSKNRLADLKLNGSELITICASNNKLKSLSVDPEPRSLQCLDVSYNELETLPDWVSRCKTLQTLTACHNRLTELPEDIFCNEDCALTTLKLSFNQLTVLPQIMRRVPIQRLYLENNSLVTLPRHFFVASSRLRILNVSKNCLKELPQIISKNEKLEQLYLTSNALTDITPLLSCVHLKKLHIAYNAISALPEGCVSAWPLINELVISGNSLCQIPDDVKRWQYLKILRAHSNLLVSSPSFVKNRALKILDLSYNYLEKIDLMSLIPKQLMYLDISGNTRMYVDSKQFHYYKNQRPVNLVDVSGHNRNSLPFHPSTEESKNQELNLPWTLGFSETSGKKEKLYISQLRLPEFCNSEALIGIFDGIGNIDLPKLFVKAAPRILLEERTVKETVCDYMKYTMLSLHRELNDHYQQTEISTTLCHLCKLKESKGDNQIKRYLLRIASVGETTTILCRNTGSLTLSHPTKQTKETRLLNSIIGSNFTWDPHVTEIVLQDHDQFLLLANKSLWNVMSIEEAVAEVRSLPSPVLAAKRLQDLAQGYGCNENLSIMVLRFHDFTYNQDLIREIKFNTVSNKIKENDAFCSCDQNKIARLGTMISEEDRSSPSGQSDKYSGSRYSQSAYSDGSRVKNYSYGKFFEPLSSKENLTEKNDIYVRDLYRNGGSLADGEESYSDKSAMHVSEERFRCWEYMLEQNTQMLFDKELDTLSRSFTKRSVPPRPDLWSPHTKSVSHLPDCVQNAPFLSKRFGSARSYHVPSRLDITRRSLSGGPNAAYFGSLQRLMPYHLEYNFSEIKEKFDNTVDSLEQDGRMHKYWDVATTEL